MGTSFTEVYNAFLSKITDDLYLELTPEDTLKDLRSLLINALPGFEFPRKIIDDYEINTVIVPESEVVDGQDFVIGLVWHELDENGLEIENGVDIQYDDEGNQIPLVYVERSAFVADLTREEINILALLMKIGWLQRQVTSIENTRMKFSGSDFKMTSQANHLAKLLNLLSECHRESHHMQRLYKRRRLDDEGKIEPNWDVLRVSVFD